MARNIDLDEIESLVRVAAAKPDLMLSLIGHCREMEKYASEQVDQIVRCQENSERHWKDFTELKDQALALQKRMIALEDLLDRSEIAFSRVMALGCDGETKKHAVAVLEEIKRELRGKQ